MSMTTRSFLQPLWRHRQLIQRLSVREIQGRYRGTALGLGWSILQPLLMLAVYTFIFSGVFKSKWGDETANNWIFALNLFAGLVTFNLFAECTSRAPSLVVAVPNYVKKVVFPLEILPAVALCTAAYHAASSLLILLIFRQVAGLPFNTSLALLPAVWLPMLMICLALGWLLSALGVYLRDLPQATSLGVNILLFTSAIFYPIAALPERWQNLLEINPVLQIIEKTRDVMIRGTVPSLTWFLASTALSYVICECCYRIFERARIGFADVI